MKTIALVAVLVAIVALAGCGSDDSTDGAADATTAAATATPEDAGLADPAKCSSDLSGLESALTDLNSRLSVGLTFQDYSEKVGDVKVAYDATGWSSMATDCIAGPGVLLEKAVNSYQRAYSAWNSCIQDYECDNDSVKPRLQKEWARAGVQIEKAQRALA